MNLLRKINWLCAAMLCLLLVVGCSDEEHAVTDKNGYVQLRLLSQSLKTRIGGLDYMADAKKIELSLLQGDKPVIQSLRLESVANGAEFGLTSEKLELRTGEYRLMSYTLYSDVKPGAEEPEKLLTGYPDADMLFSIKDGHITELELEVKSTLRGNIFFELEKDLSNYEEIANEVNQGKSRAVTTPENEFNYDDVAEVDLYYRRKGTSERPTPHQFKVYRKKGAKYFHTDTTNWAVGDYEITRFMLYSDKRTEMILAGDLDKTTVKVVPNICTQSSVAVKYPKDMLSIKDYVALYNIWIGLKGPEEWSYSGQSFPMGANWRFKDRPVDEWGNQPGVALDANGRVKTLELGSFNPVGDIPEALGQLTELQTLWVGTHNDVTEVGSADDYKYCINSYELYRRGIDFRKERWAIAKERTRLKYPRASSSIYPTEKPAFTYAQPVTYDFMQGSIANRVTSLPRSIGNLKKLTSLFVANGLISEIPMELGKLPELTDLELYNCRFKEVPEVLNQLSKLVSLNLSCNPTIPADKLYSGLNAYFGSEGAKELQLLYLVDCGLKKFPENIQYTNKIGLLDMADNKITELPNLGRSIAPVQVILDNNKITRVDDEFCDTDDIEKFLISNNLITEFPNLFGNGKGSATKYVPESIDFSFNYITRFKEGFLGLNAKTLTLSGNPLGEGTKLKGKRAFPSNLSETKSLIEFLQMNNCEVDTFPPSAFKNLKYTTAIDASGNYLRYIPQQFNVETLPYLTGLDLSRNSFARFPVEVLYVHNLHTLKVADQIELTKDASGKVIKERRCLIKWPENIETHYGLRVLDISGNDFRTIDERDFPVQLNAFYINDNPNIQLTIPTAICSRIASGLFMLAFDSNQYILGCPILDVDNNK